ncbi:MAG: CotH kinase family protein [Myxococcota bacterium]
MKLGSTKVVKPRRPRSRHRILWTTLAFAALAAWTVLWFGAGFGWRDFVRPSLQSLTGQTQMSEVIEAATGAPGRWLAARRSENAPEKIHLDIKFKHLRKIHQKREEALERGLLVTGSDDLVPAELRVGTRTVRAKVRLKGDLPDHLEGDKWSFRVHTRGGDVLFGMRRFSLQAPRTRGYQGEAIFLETLRWLGVLAPRYFFVDVSVNGKDIGLMALEEHFDKVLLESQGRREGVILKFDESLFWENYLLHGTHGAFENYRNAPISAFQKGTVARSKLLTRDLKVARSLLRGFVDGHLPASDVFDAELTGRFLAACEVWNAVHPCRWHNLRLYFNPIDQQLEPIGFDGSLQTTYLGGGLLTLQEPITRELLADPKVAESFVRAIRELSDGLEDGELLDRLRALEAEQLAILNREFPFRAGLDFSVVRRRAQELRDLRADRRAGVHHPGHRPGTRYPTVVQAHLVHEDAGAFLELASPLPVPVTVSSVRVVGGHTDTADGSLPGFPVTLPATPLGGAPTWHRVALPPVRSKNGWGVEGTALAEGQSRPQGFTAQPYVAPATQPPLPAPSVEETLRRHAFLTRSAREGWLAVRPGTWSVVEDVVLPPGMGLEASPGTTLRFGSRTVLVARGPLAFLGARDAPVRLEPLNEGTTWPGLVVLEAGAESRWTHVHVRSTRGFEQGDWKLTGAVTFYRSDVTIAHSSFEDNRGEDALNIVNAKFMLDDVTVAQTASDAFDGDFTEGVVRGGLFRNIGGDAIDVSGSQVVVGGTRLFEVRDKALSIGEGSRLEARDLVIENVGTGVVSKDRSYGSVRDSELRYVRHAALMAYVKKPEYGPAQLSAEKLTVEHAGELAIAQIGSRVTIDGVPVDESPFDADAAYDEGYMRKQQ